MGQDPEDLDPHLINGLSEYQILSALLEGLVGEDPRSGEPTPAVAEQWDRSTDGTEYTFTLRHDARWSNGEPVRAQDFVFSYKRILSERLGSSYAYMLYGLRNAEAYHKDGHVDFTEVGVKAIDDHTLVLQLHHPIPSFLSLLTHWTWYPVHPPTILNKGAIDERGTGWVEPGHFVSNGPFVLAAWKMAQKVVVKRNPYYWDAKSVRLHEIHFHSMGDATTEERAFRDGLLHLTHQLAAQ